MRRLEHLQDDFEALIRIYTTAEGGRLTAPFNRIRWDFAYAENQSPNQLYMIHPDFHDACGDPLPTDVQLPLGIEIPARMYILVDEMRLKVHCARIKTGVRFYCHEGSRRVAEGRVTAVTGLYSERDGAP